MVGEGVGGDDGQGGDRREGRGGGGGGRGVARDVEDAGRAAAGSEDGGVVVFGPGVGVLGDERGVVAERGAGFRKRSGVGDGDDLGAGGGEGDGLRRQKLAGALDLDGGPAGAGGADVDLQFGAGGVGGRGDEAEVDDAEVGGDGGDEGEGAVNGGGGEGRQIEQAIGEEPTRAAVVGGGLPGKGGGEEGGVFRSGGPGSGPGGGIGEGGVVEKEPGGARKAQDGNAGVRRGVIADVGAEPSGVFPGAGAGGAGEVEEQDDFAGGRGVFDGGAGGGRDEAQERQGREDDTHHAPLPRMSAGAVQHEHGQRRHDRDGAEG